MLKRVENTLRRIIKVCYLKALYGKRLTINKTLRFRKGLNICIESKGSILIGDNCFFNNYCSINAQDKITIGKDCIFGESVKLYDHNHIYSNPSVPVYNQGFNTAPISIGDNCWIGSNVIILKGVTIGNNVVIGANCLIYKDIPDNTIVKSSTQLIIENINY